MGWHDEKSHANNYVPKTQDNAGKYENSGTLQLQLDNEMKKTINTLTGVMGDATDEYEPDFKGAERWDLKILSTLRHSYFL